MGFGLIKYGVTKRLFVQILALDGLPATGKTVQCAISQAGNGDWWDGAIFDTGITWLGMTELSDGIYYYDFTGVESVERDYAILYRETTIPVYGSDEFFSTKIFTDMDDVYSKTDAVVSSPTIPAQITLAEASIIAEVDVNEALIITLTGNLTSHDSAIKSLIGTPIIDLITDINNRFNTVDTNIQANYDAIILIQNNVSTVLTGPKKLVRPDAGTKPYRYFVFNYDNIGNMEDFNVDPTLTGTYISGGGAYFGGTMTRDGVGQYHFDVDVAFDDTLGAIQSKLDAVIAGTLAPRVIAITSEVSDFDDELAEIKADTGAIFIKTDAGTPSPTIPAQIVTHDTDIKAALVAMEIALTLEIDENQALIETVRDDVKAAIIIPNPMVKWTGISKIKTSDGNPLLTGATTIDMDENSSILLNQDGGEVLIDKGLATEEYLEYSDITLSVMTLSSPTTQDHDDYVDILEITRVTFNLMLQRKDGLANIQADSLPTFTQDDLLGNTENSGSLAWDAVSESYIGILTFDALTRPGERLSRFSVIVDAITRKYQGNIELIDRPSSDLQVAAISGSIPPKAFQFNQDGYLDTSGILIPWTDEMVGPIKDGTGKFITGIKVRAVLMDGNVTPLLDHPHYEDFTDIFGTYRGSLEAGKYLFTWYKDNLKWMEEIRYINFP